MNNDKIESRYAILSESTCCLSCGSAIDLSKAKSGEVCIDLGSGRGTDVLRMAGIVGDNGFVYGIDLTEAMIKKSIQTAQKMGIENVKFIHGKLEEIPLEDGIADLIISNCTLNHSDNKEKVWKEIFRLLKPGGRFIISDIYSSEEVPEIYSKDPLAVAECWAGAITKEKYINIINNTGFINFDILEDSKPYDKGKIKVSSFTFSGSKKAVTNCCCCK